MTAIETQRQFTFPCSDPKCEPAKSRPYSRDRSYPSATTLGGMLEKPGLAWGAAKETAIFCLNRHDELAAMDYPDAVDRARRHHSILWQGAARLGSCSHEASECFARGEAYEPPEDLSDADFAQLSTYIGAMTAWWEREQPVVLATEMIVRHDDPNYIGTLDVLAVVRGRVVCLDWKHTRAVGEGHAYVEDWGRQLGFYMAADTLCHYHQGKLASTLPWTDDVLPRPEVGLVVNIMGDGVVREFEFERDDDVALAQASALIAVKKFKPAARELPRDVGELLVLEPRPNAPVNVDSMLS